MRTVADMLVKKAMQDLSADRRAKPRLPLKKFARDHFAITYGDKKVVAKAEADFRSAVLHHLHAAEAGSARQLRMQMVAEAFGFLTDDGFVTWPEAKTDVFLCYLCKVRPSVTICNGRWNGPLQGTTVASHRTLHRHTVSLSHRISDS